MFIVAEQLKWWTLPVPAGCVCYFPSILALGKPLSALVVAPCSGLTNRYTYYSPKFISLFDFHGMNLSLLYAIIKLD